VYKPKHSFAKLISDGTGPHSVLADDDFWQCPPDNDHKSELEEPLHSLGSEDLALECPKDTEVLFKTSSSHTQYKDAIGKMARILLNNQYIATFLAEQLLNDGILEEQCVDSGRANRCIKYMTSLMEASADPKRNRAGFNLCVKLVKSAQGRVTDKFWNDCNLLNMITRQNCKSLLSLHLTVMKVWYNLPVLMIMLVRIGFPKIMSRTLFFC
jgi:hypothetical protein